MAVCWLFLIGFIGWVNASINLDAGRDPVMQRLEIPVQNQGFGGDAPKSSNDKQQKQIIKRLWGIPDATAEAGKVFNLTLPKDAFEGHVTRYEISGRDGKPLPPWLLYDPLTVSIRGDPSSDDVGRWSVQVEAIGYSSEHTAKDVFTIHVVDASECVNVFMTLTLDADAKTVSSAKQVFLKRYVARLLHISPLDVEMRASVQVDQPTDWIRAGLGNSIRASHPLVVQLTARLPCNVNDNQSFWKEWNEISSNGHLAKKLTFPVLGWYLTSTRQTSRDKRAIEGSGEDDYDDGDYDYTNVDGEDYASAKVEPQSRTVPDLVSPVAQRAPAASATPVLQREPARAPQVTTPTSSIVIQPTRLPTVSDVEPTPVVTIQSSDPVSSMEDESSSTEAIEPTPVVTFTSPNLSLPEDIDKNDNEVEDYEEKDVPNAPQVTKRLQRITVTAGKLFRFSIPSDTFTDAEDGSTRSLRLELVTSDGKSIDEVPWIALDVEKQEIYGLPLSDDIGKWSFTLIAYDSSDLSVSELAEVIVRQHQSERTFNHRVTLEMEAELADDEIDFPQIHWMVKLVEGLAKAVGDKNTDSIVLRSTVGRVAQGEKFVVSWSNESLPRTFCPEDTINEMFDLFWNTSESLTSETVEEELAPQLAVTDAKVELEGFCKPVPAVVPAAVTETPTAFGKLPKVQNTAPQVVNPIKQVEGEAGMLFRYQVPEDTCSDTEDGNTRMLTLALYHIPREPLDPTSWLQFDVANKEFYGLPLDVDVGSEEFQLACTDSSGLTAYDTLVVRIKERSNSDNLNVEFSIKFDADFESVSNSAQRKAKLIDALAELYGDADAGHIVVSSLQPGSTVLTWTNNTLQDSTCPAETILNLRRVLTNDDDMLTQRCIDVFTAADFVPVSAHLHPHGNCLADLTPTYTPGADKEPGEAAPGTGSGAFPDDYLLTFIVPGVIITVMLLLAAVVACVLYRRRRTGKLGLEERRGFVSKGIPIIFAEELEERPSGRQPAKAPVILKVMPCKEEKPAQPPPEYHKIRASSTSPNPSHKMAAEQRDLLRSSTEEADEEPAGLYQPPPPLSSNNRDSGRQNRPKATPAYRKPPPYVPP